MLLRPTAGTNKAPLAVAQVGDGQVWMLHVNLPNNVRPASTQTPLSGAEHVLDVDVDDDDDSGGGRCTACKMLNVRPAKSTTNNLVSATDLCVAYLCPSAARD